MSIQGFLHLNIHFRLLGNYHNYCIGLVENGFSSNNKKPHTEQFNEMLLFFCLFFSVGGVVCPKSVPILTLSCPYYISLNNQQLFDSIAFFFPLVDWNLNDCIDAKLQQHTIAHFAVCQLLVLLLCIVALNASTSMHMHYELFHRWSDFQTWNIWKHQLETCTACFSHYSLAGSGPVGPSS